MAEPDILPVVGIPCDLRQIGIHPFHAVGEKYINAVAHGSRAIPLLVPGFGPGTDLEDLAGLIALDDLLDRLDGVFFTGSPSNVEPRRYGGHEPRAETMLDLQRDALTLPLFERILARGMPFFAVCRGIQELNAALGGTLHQHVHEVEGRSDHREDKARSREEQYGPAHDIEIVEGGLLHRLTGATRMTVNSLHGQGIDRLASRLRAEATAPDGQVEAVSVKDARGFALAVQWHPEWRFRERPADHALFRAFGEACRAWRASREGGHVDRPGKVA